MTCFCKDEKFLRHVECNELGLTGLVKKSGALLNISSDLLTFSRLFDSYLTKEVSFFSGVILILNILGLAFDKALSRVPCVTYVKKLSCLWKYF